MRRWLFYIIFFLSTSATLDAQNYFFKNYKIEKSINNIKINVLYQEPDHAIWLGTSKGLVMFDGLNFDLFKIPNGSSNVTAIFRDSKGHLWAGTHSGDIYKVIKNKLVKWEIEEGLPKVRITGIVESSDQVLCFSTYGEGIYFHDGKRLTNFDADDGLTSNDIYQIISGPKGHIWAATDEGINICSLNDNKKAIKILGKEDGLPDEMVTCLEYDGDNICWIGTNDGGFCKIDMLNQKILQVYSDKIEGSVKKIEHIENDQLWVVVEGTERLIYSYKNGEVLKVNNLGEEIDFTINDILYDNEGNMWLADRFLGLMSTNCQFQFLDPQTSDIQAIALDSMGNLWIGTQNGLLRFENQEGNYSKREVIISDENIISLFICSNQEIWAGSFGNGIICYDPKTSMKKYIGKSEGLKNSSILSLAGIGSTIYAATLGGVSVIEMENKKVKQISNLEGLPNHYIYKVLVDHKNRIWFGTDGDGVFVLENGELKNPIKEDDNFSIYSITEDKNKHIWMSTVANGLIEIRDDEVIYYDLESGLRDLSISSIIANRSFDLLIIHPRGIDVFSGDSIPSNYYDEEVGIFDFEPNLNAVAIGLDNEFWIAGQNNIIRYAPLQLTIKRNPTIFIHNIQLGGEIIDHLEKKDFTYKSNSFLADFDGLWYSDYQNLHFRYMLEGHDGEWISTVDRKVVYSNLTPGEYTFRLQSGLNNNFDLKDTFSYSFEINPPYWKTPWFILSALLFFVFAAYMYLRNREKRIKWLKDLEKENVVSQLKSLKSQINPHFLFNNFNTLISIIEESPKIAVEYVENLSDYFRSMLQYRDKDLIPLSEELEIINNYVYLIQKRYGNNFILEKDISEDHSNNDYVIPMVLQLLVENAVKHNIISKEKPLKVKISMNGDDNIIVQNNLQTKLTKSASTNFGIQSIEKRYALQTDKRITVTKDDKFFTVSIPIIKNQNS